MSIKEIEKNQYAEFLKEVKERIRDAQINALKAVNKTASVSVLGYGKAHC